MMEDEEQTNGPPNEKSKGPAYYIQGSVYYKLDESATQVHLYCCDYRNGCPAKIVIDKDTGNCQMLIDHSHSKPSEDQLKYLNAFDEGNVTFMFCSTKSGRLLDLPFCKYCQRGFHDFDLYKRHVWRHERYYLPFWRGKVTYTCKYCKQTFRSRYTLRQHDNTHPFQCAKCETCFPSTLEYLCHVHKLNRHGKIVPIRSWSANPSVSRLLERKPEQNKNGEIVPVRLSSASSASQSFERKPKQNGLREIVPLGLSAFPSVSSSSEISLHGQMEEYLFCSHCRKSFESRAEVLEHNIDYPIFCSGCQTCLATTLEYFEHSKLHKSYRPKKAKSCYFHGCAFDSAEQRWNHKCSLNSYTKRTYTRRTGKQRKCKLCLKSFSDGVILLKHRCKTGVQNKDAKEGKVKRGRPKSHKCERCSKSYLSYDQLQEHECSKAGLFKCQLCLMFFASEEILSQHLEEHHSCRHCRMLFQSKHKLGIHMRQNHEYHCPHCEQVLTSQTQVYQHVISDHKCKFCKATYLPTKQALAEHEKLHKFNCFFCPLKFLTQNSSRLHMKHEHMNNEQS